MNTTPDNAPVFLDCDTGIDDALALAYLLGAALAGLSPKSAGAVSDECFVNAHSSSRRSG